MMITAVVMWKVQKNKLKCNNKKKTYKKHNLLSLFLCSIIVQKASLAHSEIVGENLACDGLKGARIELEAKWRETGMLLWPWHSLKHMLCR